MPIDGQEIIKQYSALKSARANRDTLISTMAPYVDPSRGDATGEPVEGQSWMTDVYDSQGQSAHELSAHYIQGNSTNPGKKWFGLKDENTAINEDDEVKEWCEESRDRMLRVIDKSNFYEADFQIRKDWWGFGCGSGLIEEREHLDYRPMSGYRGLNLTCDMVGRFVADWDTWGMARCHGVERMWSAGAAVSRFGLDNVGPKVQEAYKNNKLDTLFKFVHFISPRKQGEYGDKPKQKMAFKWCWVEFESKKVCEEGGYERMPAVVPRQSGLFGEPYARGRADLALNDLVTLSTGKRMSFEDWALKIRPITMVRSQVLFGKQRLIPGSFLQANWTGGRPLSDAFFQFDGGGKPEVSAINIEQLQASIDSVYLIRHLQQLLAFEGSHQQTAFERAQLERQVLRLIASIHTSYESQFLKNFIDVLFDQMFMAGEFSPPPDIMLQEGGKLMVTFDSPLSQTQMLDELQAMEEYEMSLWAYAGNYAKVYGKPPPELDLIDGDEWQRVKAEKMKVPAGPIRSAREVALIRQSRAEEERNQVINQELAGGAEALGRVAPFLKAVQDQKAA